MPFDLDRIEVLRGPQGTLYGAGAMGGLLKYVLTTPNTYELQEEAGVDFGSIDGADRPAMTVQAHVNVPILEDQLAISASVYDNYTPGYIDNAYSGASGTNSDKQYGGRIATLWQPTDSLTIKLNALWQRVDSRDDATLSFGNPKQTVQPDGSLLLSGGQGFGDLTENKAFLAPFKNNVDFYSATIDWNPGPIDFVSATSWSETRLSHQADDSIAYGSYLPLFGLPAGLVKSTLDLDLNKFTQEFRVSSPQEDTLSWLVGVFYTDEHETNDQFVSAYDTAYQPIAALQPYAGFASIPTSYREYAGFGDLTWKVTDNFDVSAGARYSQNSQEFHVASSGLLLGEPQSPVTTLPSVSSTQGDTTWMASARYHISEDVMAYGRVATGYAPGGANTPYPGAPTTVGPETLTSYEIGLKSQVLDKRVLLDVAAFHIDWENIQLPAETNNIGYTENGGTATSDGFEFSGKYSPIQGLMLGFNAAYTDAELESRKANVSVPFVLDTQLEDVPKWSLSWSADYDWALVADWRAHIGSTIRWVGEESATEKVIGQIDYMLPANTVVDLNASVAKDGWTVRAYVNNLTNERAYESAYPNTDAFGVTQQLDYVILQPRTVGVGVIAKF
jgi:outer membrane receptor protein involved in Fe transport